MTPPAGGGSADHLRGVGLFCLTLICFTCLDSMAKYCGRHVPIVEIMWFRYAGQTVLVAIGLRVWRDWSVCWPVRPLAQTLRAAFLFGSTFFNFLALRTLQLDQTATIGFAAAFVIAGLAGPLLGEWIGPRRWAAIAVGFCGVLLVLQPTGTHLDPALLLSIVSMLCYSAYNLMTRQLARTESSTSLVLISSLLPSIFLTPIAIPVMDWTPEPATLAALLSTGVFGAVGHGMIVQAYRRAPASLLAPFGYTQIIWMPLSGFILFGDLPSHNTIFGAAIIVASGLYLLYRERVHGGR